VEIHGQERRLEVILEAAVTVEVLLLLLLVLLLPPPFPAAATAAAATEVVHGPHCLHRLQGTICYTFVSYFSFLAVCFSGQELMERCWLKEKIATLCLLACCWASQAKKQKTLSFQIDFYRPLRYRVFCSCLQLLLLCLLARAPLVHFYQLQVTLFIRNTLPFEAPQARRGKMSQHVELPAPSSPSS